MAFGKKQVLFIGNDSLHHYLYKGHYAYLQEEYFWDQPDLVRNLAAALQKVGQNVPVSILSDQTEQQYRKDVLPKVGALDKRKMVERKLNMAFPQLPYRAALPLKTVAPRENDITPPNVLFAGLPQTPEISRVIQAVTESEVVLGDIGLVPMESVPIANRLIKLLHERTQVIDRPRWTILLTQQKTGGMRQVVLQDGELALTRLTPIFISNDSELGQVRDLIIKEFQATLTYLARFGYVPADGIDVIAITSEIMGEGLQQAALPVTHLYTLSVAEATRLLKSGPKIAGDTLYSDGLLAALAAGHKFVLPLQNATLKPLQQGRKMVWAAGLLLAVSMLALCGAAGMVQMQTSEINSKNEVGLNDMRTLQVRYNDLARQLNTLKYQPEMVQAVLNVRDELLKTNLNTEPTLQAIESLVDKGSMVLKSVVIEPAKLNAETVGGPPPTPPLDTAVQTYPPRVTITLQIAFVNAGDVEQSARLTEQLVNSLKGKFTQHVVRISQMVGNLSVDETVRGLSEQVSTLQVQTPEAQRNEFSEIQITGVAL